MKKLISLSLVIASCLLFSCQKEALEDKSTDKQDFLASNAKEQNARPFKATYTTSSEILQPAPFLRTRITGIGHASHLGKSSFVALSALNLTGAPPFQLGGTATFTAANGDEFYTTFTGTAAPNGLGSLNIFMTHMITGGTGKFKNASGSFVGNTVAVPGHTEGSIDNVGTISY